MKQIVPHLWFDKGALDGATFYTSLFPDSSIIDTVQLEGTPSGNSDGVTFTLCGQKFMAISAGPYFTMNPSISLFVVFDNEEEITKTWNALIEGGKPLMEFQEYPWAKKYGWVQDKYGLTWQLSMSEHHQMPQRITPLLMFTQKNAGLAKQAIEEYVSIFPQSSIDMLAHYEKGEKDKEEFLKHARFTLNNQHFMAMDSSLPHGFTFNEGISLLIECEDQEEIDYYYEKLSADPKAEQCGWIKDKFGVSWQINPVRLQEMLSSDDKEKVKKVTQAFLAMKKFDLTKLEEAFNS